MSQCRRSMTGLSSPVPPAGMEFIQWHLLECSMEHVCDWGRIRGTLYAADYLHSYDALLVKPSVHHSPPISLYLQVTTTVYSGTAIHLSVFLFLMLLLGECDLCLVYYILFFSFGPLLLHHRANIFLSVATTILLHKNWCTEVQSSNSV